MSEQVSSSLADLKDMVAGTPAASVMEAAIKREPKRDPQGRSYATGSGRVTRGGFGSSFSEGGAHGESSGAHGSSGGGHASGGE